MSIASLTSERLSPDFYKVELACKHCGVLRLHPGFLDKLQGLRDSFGVAMSPTSGCRCAVYNEQVGGHFKSLHVFDREQHPGQQGTLAVDIAARYGSYRGALFSVAWGLGWSIGWNAKKGFLHLDRRDFVGLPQTSFDY